MKWLWLAITNVVVSLGLLLYVAPIGILWLIVPVAFFVTVSVFLLILVAFFTYSKTL